jgi:hypothetical protein
MSRPAKETVRPAILRLRARLTAKKVRGGANHFAFLGNGKLSGRFFSDERRIHSCIRRTLAKCLAPSRQAVSKSDNGAAVAPLSR